MGAAEKLKSNLDLSDDENAVLVLSIGEDWNYCSYYLVSRHEPRIFWLEHDKLTAHCTSKFCKRTPQVSTSHCW